MMGLSIIGLPLIVGAGAWIHHLDIAEVDWVCSMVCSMVTLKQAHALTRYPHLAIYILPCV